MIDAFEELSNLGWGNVILIFLLCIVFIVAFLQSIRFICEYFGIETKHTLKDKKRDEEIQKMKEDIIALQKSAEKFNEDRSHDREQSLQIQKNLIDNLLQISNTLDEIKKDIVEEKLERKRWNILNFADELRHNGGDTDRERFDSVFRDYDDYERILQENDLSNGFTEESIKFIKMKYQEMLNSDDE